MAKLARDIMTRDPACCLADTPLDQVARMMIQNDCGEIPVIDNFNHPVGVITDRDIVCRIVAEGKNPIGHTAESAMTRSPITISPDEPIDKVVDTMRSHQIRRVLVVDGDGCCSGIIAQADVASDGPARAAIELVRDVSRETGRPAL
jgi:CBS domain-containing protein